MVQMLAVEKYLQRTIFSVGVSLLIVGSVPYSPRANAQGFPACQLTAQSGRIIVTFNNKLIRGSQALAVATDGPVSATIPAGTYNVSLMSYDDHTGKGGQGQLNEQYFLILSNGQQTNSIGDLPENDDTLVEQVNPSFVITGAITSVTARHTRYPEPGFPNSIVPICAVFDEVVTTPTPTPTVTPTPTPTVTPSGATGGSGDEQDCCPGPDTVAPTTSPTAVGKVKGTKTVVAVSPTPTPHVAAFTRFPKTGFPLPLWTMLTLLPAGALLIKFKK